MGAAARAATAPPTAPPTAPLLNASARAALERDGFVVVERFLAPALVAGLRADAAALGAAGKFVRVNLGDFRDFGTSALMSKTTSSKPDGGSDELVFSPRSPLADG